MIEDIKRFFEDLPDPRSELGRRHRLDEMIIIAILAVICSADDWCEVVEFSQAKESWLKKFFRPAAWHSLARYFQPRVL